MALQETISDAMKTAMKSGDRLRLETLRTIRASLLEREIEARGSGRALSPEDEMAVLTGAAKKRRESIEQFEKGGRIDLADQERAELRIIQEYLPRQASPEEIRTVVSRIVHETGATGPSGFGTVMPLAMKQLKGKAEGKVVQEIVREMLGVS